MHSKAMFNFTFSALVGPVFGSRLAQMPEGNDELALAHYQAGFKPSLYGVLMALVLTWFLNETGPAARKMNTDEVKAENCNS